jgi:hypothetical protein
MKIKKKLSILYIFAIQLDRRNLLQLNFFGGENLMTIKKKLTHIFSHFEGREI